MLTRALGAPALAVCWVAEGAERPVLSCAVAGPLLSVAAAAAGEASSSSWLQSSPRRYCAIVRFIARLAAVRRQQGTLAGLHLESNAMLQSTGFNMSIPDSLHTVRLVLMMLPAGHVRHLRCPVPGCQLRPVPQAPQRTAPAAAFTVPV